MKNEVSRRPPGPAPTLGTVRRYWEDHPLYSFEVAAEPGTAQFFEAVDRVKRQDVERFAMAYWAFDAWAGKRVLDVGCGPGWLTVQYARAGAAVTSVDLTARATELTRRHLALHGLSARVCQASAEELPFATGSFDLVIASGVLHHTPDTARAVREARRVLAPGGEAKLTLYHKGLLHGRLVFPAMRAVMRLLSVRHPAADMGREAGDVDEFIRQYDGRDNPVGRGYATAEARALFEAAGLRMAEHELHFFPARMVPLGLARRPAVHGLLDRAFGTMIYPRLFARG